MVLSFGFWSSGESFDVLFVEEALLVLGVVEEALVFCLQKRLSWFLSSGFWSSRGSFDVL